MERRGTPLITLYSLDDLVILPNNTLILLVLDPVLLLQQLNLPPQLHDYFIAFVHAQHQLVFLSQQHQLSIGLHLDLLF